MVVRYLLEIIKVAVLRFHPLSRVVYLLLLRLWYDQSFLVTLVMRPVFSIWHTSASTYQAELL